MSSSGNGSGLEANWSADYNCSNANYRADNCNNGIDWVKVGQNTIIYVLPVIIIGGTVGNVLSMVTLCSRHFRHAPCTVLLFMLAVVDTLVLCYAGGLNWATYLFPTALNELFAQHSTLGCFLPIALDIVTAISPWTVVLITVERFVSVMWPFQAGTICSTRKMVTSWFAVLLIIIPIYGCFYLIAGGVSCGMSLARLQHLEWVRFAIRCVGPLVFIVAGNAGIIYKTCVASRDRTRTVGSSSAAAASAASDARSITVMLVAVCVVFLLTVYPYYLILLVLRYYTYNSLLHAMALFSIVLYYVNSATNFILYFTTGRLFRRAFIQVMCRCKPQTPSRHNVQRGLQRGNNCGGN